MPWALGGTKYCTGKTTSATPSWRGFILPAILCAFTCKAPRHHRLFTATTGWLFEFFFPFYWALLPKRPKSMRDLKKGREREERKTFGKRALHYFHGAACVLQLLKSDFSDRLTRSTEVGFAGLGETEGDLSFTVLLSSFLTTAASRS